MIARAHVPRESLLDGVVVVIEIEDDEELDGLWFLAECDVVPRESWRLQGPEQDLIVDRSTMERIVGALV